MKQQLLSLLITVVLTPALFGLQSFRQTGTNSPKTSDKSVPVSNSSSLAGNFTADADDNQASEVPINNTISGCNHDKINKNLSLTAYGGARRHFHHSRDTANATNASNSSYNSSTSNKNRVLEGFTYEPIRVVFDYTGLQNVPGIDGATMDYLQSTFFPNVSDYLTSLLKVIPYESPLLFSRNGYCNTAQLPSRFTTSPGVEGDLAIFVTASYDDSGYIAWAIPCFYDGSIGRPIAGQVNINLNNFGIPSSYSDSQFKSVIHEVTHVLGLSWGLFGQFLDTETGDELPTSRVVQQATIRNTSTFVIVMPEVVAFARQYYNCSTLKGVELENQGSSASRFSHWERRVLGNEYMTASLVAKPTITNFTLFFLDGTGWYQTNHSMAQDIDWGRGQGCSFINDKCINSQGKAAFKEFCSDIGKHTCIDPRTVATCAAVYTPNLASSFSYFTTEVGGTDQFDDGCPTYTPTTYCTGTNARCLTGTTDLTSTFSNDSYFCASIHCGTFGGPDLIARINFPDVSVDCTAPGQIINAGSQRIVCPDTASYCSGLPTETFTYSCADGACSRRQRTADTSAAILNTRINFVLISIFFAVLALL